MQVGVAWGELAGALVLEDPPIDEVHDLTNSLVAGKNSIRLEGLNAGGPMHFVGRLAAKKPNGSDFEVGSWDVGPGNAKSGSVFDREYVVMH